MKIFSNAMMSTPAKIIVISLLNSMMAVTLKRYYSGINVSMKKISRELSIKYTKAFFI